MDNHSKPSRSNRGAKSGHRSGAGKNSSAGLIRIVAGSWRGRKIPVVDADGLRPTGDRVRETLFNWLQLHIPGRRCLDLFAGSGALGLEAASRGAASVSLVESSARVSSQLRETLRDLGADESVTLHSNTAEAFLATEPEPYDVIFVDPPFDLQVHERILNTLVPYLAPEALVYVELPTAQRELLERLPAELEVVRDKRFGDVTVFLLQHVGVAP